MDWMEKVDAASKLTLSELLRKVEETEAEFSWMAELLAQDAMKDSMGDAFRKLAQLKEIDEELYIYTTMFARKRHYMGMDIDAIEYDLELVTDDFRGSWYLTEDDYNYDGMFKGKYMDVSAGRSIIDWKKKEVDKGDN